MIPTWFATFLASAALAPSGELGVTRTSEVVPPGVVVEAVQRGFVAELAGIRVGDVLFSWSQAGAPGGERRGEIASPLLVADLEFGRLTRGPVTLHGTREGAPLRVDVRADGIGLGLTLRPRFPPALLDVYLRGRTEIEAGRVKAGTSLWREVAARARGIEGGAGVDCWLLAQTGTAWAVAREADAAREAYDDAAACAEDVDTRAVATILEWQADQENELGAPETAASALQAAVGLRYEHSDSAALSVADSLFKLGLAQRVLGRATEEHETLTHLLALAEREAPDSILVSRVLVGIGFGHQLEGDFEAAEATFLRAADIVERVGPWSRTWAWAQTALAFLAGARGDLATNEELSRKVMEHRMRHMPDSLQAATALMNLGAVTQARGDLAAARRLYEAALRVLEPLPTGRHSRGVVLSNLGDLALERGDTDEALQAFERAAVDIYATAPKHYMVAMIEVNISEALSARGDLAGARAHAETGLEAAERFAPRSPAMMMALVTRGRLARREGDWDLAEKCFARALATRDALDADPPVTTLALQGLAAVLRHRGDAEGAERHLRRAVALFESQRGKVGRSDEERSLFISGFHGIYRDLVDLLAQQGRMPEAFQVLEASRARSLLSMLAARDLLFDRDVPVEMERELRAVEAAYERGQQRLARLPAGAGDAEVMRGKLAELRERQVQLDTQIRQASPRLAGLREPQPLDAPGVAAHLDRGTLLIAYSIGSEGTVAFALESGGDGALRGYLIPAGEDELRRRIEALRKLAEAGPPGKRFHAEARGLYALLLGPLAEPLAKARRLIISPDGPLNALPFAALEDERGFLAESKALAFVPSGTVYAQQTAARTARTWGPPAAFGDPRYAAGTYAQLPGSRREVSAVATAFPATRTYLASNATEDRVKSLDRGGRFVHFAVHGIVDERAPLDSALALSAPPASAKDRDNGMLYAWEIFERVRLDADLVTLSACRSASGTDRRGEGIMGLTRAFFYAGAHSVLASLWNVGDASTGTFMRSFYGAWARGEPKAEALRHAQLAAIRRGQWPLRWAGFQLYGDDR